MQPPMPITLDAEDQVERLLRDLRLVDCNDALAEQYGFPRAEAIIGRNVAFLLDASNPTHRDYLRAFVHSGYRLEGVEYAQRAPDGTTTHFVTHLVGTVRGGHLTGAWGVQVDATARRQLEQQSRQAETVTALNRLAGGVAHDFNNLLTTILTSIEMLEDTLEPHHIGRQDAEEVRRAARRGAELTRQLLALSQQQVLAPRPSDLNVIVRRAVSSMRRTLRPDLDIRAHTTSVRAIANVDGEELEQVLVTLGAFAADAIGRGGQLDLQVGRADLDAPIAGTPDYLSPGSYATITVTDSAPAFAPGAGARLFEPFFGVELPDTGSGLALATLRGFVRQSGGSVLLESPEAGRRLTVYFPIAVLPSGDATADDRHATASSGTVILAEDEPTVRLLMKRVLQRAGYVVLQAASGEEAIEISRTYPHEVDALVTDVIMPGMGGGELSRRLRQERPGIRVLHVSGYTAGALRLSEALEDGAAFLPKPFTPKALVARLQEVMRR